MSDAPLRDWPEDFDHENGRYGCICFKCGRQFVGHKRRHLCRACYHAQSTTPAPASHGADRAAATAVLPPLTGGERKKVARLVDEWLGDMATGGEAPWSDHSLVARAHLALIAEVGRRDAWAAEIKIGVDDLKQRLIAAEAQVQRLREALVEFRQELFALCEDTETRCATIASSNTEEKMGAYARGRIREAESIRNAMGEVIRMKLAALSADPPAAQWRCKECGCQQRAFMDERQSDGSYAAGPSFRCVNCKRETIVADPPAEQGQRQTMPSMTAVGDDG